MGKKIKIVVDVTERGRSGGLRRAENLSPEALSAAGTSAARARWDAYYREHPEKLKAKKARDARRAAGSSQAPKKQRR